jgi:protein translocase SecG subunit
MQFILGLLAVTAVVSSIILLVVILLQEPKGGGLAAALGGSGMEAIGVNTGSVNKFTSTVAAIWIVACLAHALMMETGPSIPTEDGGNTPADTGTENGGGGGGGGSGSGEEGN